MIGVLFDECVNRRYASDAFAEFADIAESRQSLARNASDSQVLALARVLGRILVTEDVGFGRLIFLERLPPPPGLILISNWRSGPVLREQPAAHLPVARLRRPAAVAPRVLWGLLKSKRLWRSRQRPGTNALPAKLSQRLRELA